MNLIILQKSNTQDLANFGDTKGLLFSYHHKILVSRINNHSMKQSDLYCFETIKMTSQA